MLFSPSIIINNHHHFVRCVWSLHHRGQFLFLVCAWAELIVDALLFCRHQFAQICTKWIAITSDLMVWHLDWRPNRWQNVCTTFGRTKCTKYMIKPFYRQKYLKQILFSAVIDFCVAQMFTAKTYSQEYGIATGLNAIKFICWKWQKQLIQWTIDWPLYCAWRMRDFHTKNVE